MAVDHFGPQNSISACLAKLQFDSVYGTPSVEVPLLASLYPGVCLLGAFMVSPGTTGRDYENGTLPFIYIFIPVVCRYLASTWLSTCAINHFKTPIHYLQGV